MAHATRNELRTGALIAWCHTCHCEVPPEPVEPLPNFNRYSDHYSRDYMREWRRRKSA